MKEIWVDIIDYEDYYQVSNFGRIRSKNRVHKGRNRFSEFERKLKGRIVKTTSERNGYKSIELYKNGNGRRQSVHRIVIESFDGRIPDGLIVHHKDEIKQNNHLSNLELTDYVTHNNHHSHPSWNKGIKTKKETQIKMIVSRTKAQLKKSNIAHDLKKQGLTVKEIANIMDFTGRHIYDLLNKRDYYINYLKTNEA